MASDKKEIFLASRFEEFKEIREKLVNEIAEYDFMQAIDLNNNQASSRSPIEECLLHVRKSEIMILLLGETYGSEPKGETKSYTHLEYDEACKKSSNTRVLVFCIGKSYQNGIEYSKTDEKMRVWQQDIEDNFRSSMFSSSEDIDEIVNHIMINLHTEIFKLLSENKFMLTDNEMSQLTNKSEYEEALIKEVVGFLQEKSEQKKNEIEMLQTTVLKYLPEHYSNPIPSTADEIIQFLVNLSYINKNIPIICVLRELEKKYNYPVEIKDYLHYLTETKYKDHECECLENKQVKERAFLIEFYRKEHDTFTINIWEFFNNKFIKISQFRIKEIIYDSGIKDFFDELTRFFNQTKYRNVNIHLEIILPLEILAKGIKSWNYSGKYEDQQVISTYKYTLRIQERFRKFDVMWENKWTNIEQNNTLIENKHVFVSSKYNKEISGANLCVLSEEKVEDIVAVLRDIDQNNISIALLHLSDKIDVIKCNKLYSKTVKECKESIGDYIRENRDENNPDLLFLFDDPQRVPEEWKEEDECYYE